MASGIIGGRGTSTVMRAVWRTTAQKRTAKKSATVTNPTSVSLSSSIRFQIRPQNFTFRHCPRFSPRLVRRELSSLVPLHSVIASACLVSNLPSDVNSSAEGMLLSLFFHFDILDHELHSDASKLSDGKQIDA